LKIQALELKVGDRIFAYCNNKMQICVVRRILEPGKSGVALSVSTSEHSRSSACGTVRFREDALLERQAK
jgi:hypothetical protein